MAGLKEYADFKAMVLGKLKERRRTKLGASDALGGKDPELLPIYQEVIDTEFPAAPDYREYVADHLTSTASAAGEALCMDPQTSGGLLAAVDPSAAAQLGDGWWRVGVVGEGPARLVLR